MTYPGLQIFFDLEWDEDEGVPSHNFIVRDWIEVLEKMNLKDLFGQEEGWRECEIAKNKKGLQEDVTSTCGQRHEE